MTQLRAALRGDLKRHMRAERRALDTGVSRGVKETTDELKEDVRSAVRQGLRARSGRGDVSKAIRGVFYPNQDQPASAAGLVYSKFGRREGGEFVDYLKPHIEGATIEPERSKWLYIPNERGRKARRFKRQSVALQRNLAFVRVSDRKAYLVRRTRTRSTIIATLVRRVRIKDRITLKGAIDTSEAALPRNILRQLEASDTTGGR